MNHRCLFSLGHDEYWSQPMRQGAAQANASGVNLAFLGANACYRQIRMEPTSNGPNRLQVCYKSATEDPMAQQTPELTTVNWGQAPVNQPRVDPHRVHVPVRWRQGRHGGHRRVVVVLRRLQSQGRAELSQDDLGRVRPLRAFVPRPENADVLAHSPVPGQWNWSDITYYTAPGNGGGVLASGSASFVAQLSTTGVIPSLVVPGPFPGISDVFNRAMENLYGRFGLGPASSYGSSGGNWSAAYTGSAAAAGSAAGTPSA